MTTGVGGVRKSLSLLAWPTADRLAWQAATSPGRDIFDDAGPASHWAASTRGAVQYDYGRWLGYVAMSEPNALALAPGARASKERLVGFLGHLGETVRSVGQHSTIRHLRDALVAMVPGWDRTWLDRLVGRLERDRRARDKRPRLVASDRLLALGYVLMNTVSPGPVFEVEDLLAYRDGLMIALLASRPLRRRNFAAIEIGRQLIRVGQGFHLVFDGSETKSGQPIETDVPAHLVAPLEHYLARIRPRFPQASTHRALWAGWKGRGLGGHAIYATVAARTRAPSGMW